jgi:hypothetical protein
MQTMPKMFRNHGAEQAFMPAVVAKNYRASAPEDVTPTFVQTRRAEALPGFPFAAPLHEKKTTPGEAPGVGGGFAFPVGSLALDLR